MMKRSGFILLCEVSGTTTSTTANLLSIGPLLANLLGTHFAMSSRASSLTSVSALATGKSKNSGNVTTIAGCVPSDVEMMTMHPENENNTTGNLDRMKTKTPSMQRRTSGRTRGSPRQLLRTLSPPTLMSFTQGQSPGWHLQVLQTASSAR